jgi:hypothetical protein
MALTLRKDLNRPLSIEEMDGNFETLQSSSLGSIITTTVNVTNEQLSTWGSGSSEITLLPAPSDPNKAIKLVSATVLKTGNLAQEFIDNAEIVTLQRGWAFDSSTMVPLTGSYKYDLMVTPGVQSGGGISYYSGTLIENTPIGISNVGTISDVGTCALEFTFEYRLIDVI